MTDHPNSNEIAAACARLFDLHRDGDPPRARGGHRQSRAPELQRTARPAYAWF